MPVRPILTDPDPVLRAVAAPVGQVDAATLSLVADLFETMYAAPGRGLAAPQVGVSARVFVMDVTWKEGERSPFVAIDPEIVARSEEIAVGPEACLSIPDRSFAVARPVWIELARTRQDGVRETVRLDGAEAVCAAHEADHLDGILITDHGTEIA